MHGLGTGEIDAKGGIAPGTPAASPTPRVHAAFTGENGEFRRLVTRGALLELVTFGFYRLWLATNIRRHLWSNTSAGGDALEYTGTARELLIGFLFALTILVPIYLVYFVIGIEAERWKAFASVPMGLFYYGFWQFAVYRARRYRLTRTSWRGVCFWMTGSGTAYALRAFGWTVLTIVTLGLAYPWRAAELERYKMANTFYGDLPGRFEGKGWDFFKRGWRLWLLCILAVAGYDGIIGLVAFFAAPSNQVAARGNKLDFAKHAPSAPLEGEIEIGLSLLTLVLLLVLPFIYAAFKTMEWKWWLQGLRLGDARFDSNLERAPLIGNYYKMALAQIAVAVVAVGIPLFAIPYIIWLVWDIDLRSGHPSPALIALVIGGYLALILAFGVVQRIYLVQRIWKLVVSSIGIENLGAAEHVVAKGEAASAIGEGLADSLDVAGF